MILEFWKTDKVFTFAADYILGVYAYVYAHIKIQKTQIKPNTFRKIFELHGYW